MTTEIMVEGRPVDGTLVIHSARFGTSNGTDSKDVTPSIRAKVIDNRLNFTVGRYGLPARTDGDQLRRLFVDYEYIGRAVSTLSAVEGKRVVLP